MSYKIDINGTIIQTLPQGLEDFSVARNINYDDFTIEMEYVTDLTFFGDGYELLKGLADDNYAQVVPMTITKICKGNNVVVDLDIRITNVEFDLVKCSARTKGIQRDFIGRIKNGWNKKISMTGGYDDFGDSLPAPAVSTISINHPFDDSSYGNIPTWGLKAAFQYYVDYLTGSNLVVVSDWIDGLDSDELLVVTSGIAVRNQTQTAPTTTFKKLFQDHAKAFNLLMGIVYEDGIPYLRIEKEEFWHDLSTGVNKNSIFSIKERFNEDRLYSTVKYGSRTTIEGDGGSGQSLPALSLFGFIEEEFNVRGSDSLDQTLNLVLDNIVDSNVIEDIMVNSTETYDDDAIYLQVDNTNTAYQPAGALIPGRAILNDVYLKSNIVQRWNFQGNLERYKKIEDNTYQATQYTGASFLFSNGSTKLIFTNDSTPPNFDTSGNWNTSTSRFTAPETDLYTLELRYLFRLLVLETNNGFLRSRVKVYNSGGTLKFTYYGNRIDYWSRAAGYGINPFPTDVHRVIDVFYVYMGSTDYAEYEILAQVDFGNKTNTVQHVVSGNLSGNTTYQQSACIDNKSAGGVVRVCDPSLYRVRKYEFEENLKGNEMISIIQQPHKGVGFSGNNLDRTTGWGDVEFKLGTGAATFMLAK